MIDTVDLVRQGRAQGLHGRPEPDRQRRSTTPTSSSTRTTPAARERNYTGYCNPEVEKLFDQQSVEIDQEKRKKLVWEIDRKLQEDVARPIIMHNESGTCWQPEVKGMTILVNASYNRYRFEDVWLDR